MRYVELSMMLSLIVGVLCIAAGFLRLGFLADFLSRPTTESFATRNGYEVDASREFIALGCANLASAISHGFAVSGADSRTAISDVAGGKTR